MQTSFSSACAAESVSYNQLRFARNSAKLFSWGGIASAFLERSCGHKIFFPQTATTRQNCKYSQNDLTCRCARQSLTRRAKNRRAQWDWPAVGCDSRPMGVLGNGGCQFPF